MKKDAYHKLRQVEAIIIATPVMTYGITGALKCFMDRCQPFYMVKYFRKQPLITPEHAKIRRTLFLCIGGMNARLDIFTGPVLTTKAFSMRLWMQSTRTNCCRTIWILF